MLQIELSPLRHFTHHVRLLNPGGARGVVLDLKACASASPLPYVLRHRFRSGKAVNATATCVAVVCCVTAVAVGQIQRLHFGAVGQSQTYRRPTLWSFLTFFSSCLSASAPPGGALRADFKSIYGHNFGVRLLTRIVFLLLWAALVLKMAIFTIF
jgi:hypothetical protein